MFLSKLLGVSMMEVQILVQQLQFRADAHDGTASGPVRELVPFLPEVYEVLHNWFW